MEGWWGRIGAVGTGSRGGFPGLSGDCPAVGGVTAVTRDEAGCKEDPGAMAMQLPHVWASWQQLQRAQSMPEGARSFPRRRNAVLCPHPLGPRLQPAQRGPRDDFGTKGSHFFFFPNQAARLLAQSQLSAACLPGTCHPTANSHRPCLCLFPEHSPAGEGLIYFSPISEAGVMQSTLETKPAGSSPHPSPSSHGSQQASPSLAPSQERGSLTSLQIRSLSARSLTHVLQNAPESTRSPGSVSDASLAPSPGLVLSDMAASHPGIWGS